MPLANFRPKGVDLDFSGSKLNLPHTLHSWPVIYYINELNAQCFQMPADVNRKPHHEGVDALQANPANLRDAAGFCLKEFCFFPEMAVAPKSSKKCPTIPALDALKQL